MRQNSMSIQVTGISKVYGAQRALGDISFSVNEGEIVGFLGPNGAGKSTTFKIITGYIPPTTGNVWVSGISVTDQPLAVRRQLGYLPEHNPLYLDMYVHEYLHLMGQLSGIEAKRIKACVGEMVERCGLTREQNKKIETLSKGYRQRIGLAQALLHNPRVLILDEPTSGLDPNQLVEIRKLIKDVSRDKTVIFSTHIMQEVEALCDRVVLINKGEIVADDRLSVLLKQEGVHSYIIEFDGPVAADQVSSLEAVASVQMLPSASTALFRITLHGGGDARTAVLRSAAERQLPLVGLRPEERNLEKIFQELTTPTP